jgi:hypothetical protein
LYLSILYLQLPTPDFILILNPVPNEVIQVPKHLKAFTATKLHVVINPTNDLWIQFLSKPLYSLECPVYLKHISHFLLDAGFRTLANDSIENDESLLLTELVLNSPRAKTISKKVKAVMLMALLS